MRTAIIGGAGFIGSHLAEHLLDAGDTVTVLDDFSSGRPQNLKGCRTNPAFTLHEGSTRDGDAVRRAIGGSDRVFHLAASGGTDPLSDRPPGSSRSGSHGTRAVLDASLEAGAEVLLASTGGAPGTNAWYRTSGIPSSRRPAETAAVGPERPPASAPWRTYGPTVVVVRIFTTVGPRQTRRYGAIVPDLVGRALRNDPLVLSGDGRQTRCFSYVGDIVPAMARIIAEPGTRGLTIDLGGFHEVSDLELAQRTIRLLNSRSTISFVPTDPFQRSASEDAPRLIPDPGLARRLGRFEPRSSVDTIILKIARDILSAASNGVHAEGVRLREPALRE